MFGLEKAEARGKGGWCLEDLPKAATASLVGERGKRTGKKRERKKEPCKSTWFVEHVKNWGN